MTEPSFSIIVPVYNEKQNVYPTTEGILKAFDQLAPQVEIIFVDDNSPDGTSGEVVRVSRLVPQVRLVQHGKKEGIGAAHLAGYRAAKGKYILCIDADLSQDPNDLVIMKEKLDDGYDLVIGSRYVSGGRQIGKSFMRDVGSRGMNLMSRYLLGIPIADATPTFRGFRIELFKDIESKLDQKGHPTFQVQFCFWAVRKGYRTTEFPITFIERATERGQSKLSVRKEVPSFLKFVLRLMFVRFFMPK